LLQLWAMLAGGWRLENTWLRDKTTGESYLLTIVLADSLPLSVFQGIATSTLSAFSDGRLSTTPVVP
jgi:hypothetical protein